MECPKKVENLDQFPRIFDSDIHNIIVNDYLEKKSQLRKKIVGLEILNDTNETLPKESSNNSYKQTRNKRGYKN
jgi:hypothetical protein